MTPMERVAMLTERGYPMPPALSDWDWLLRVARAAVEWREVMPADGDGKPYLVSAPSELLALIAAVEDK